MRKLTKRSLTAASAALVLSLLSGALSWSGSPFPVREESPAAQPLGQETTAAERKVRASYANLPLRFEPNRGQTDRAVKFLSRGSRETLFLTADEAVLAVPGEARNGDISTNVVRMRLAGADDTARVQGQERVPGVSNYLLGDNPNRWVTGVPSYSRVHYVGVYPGIDLVYHGDDRGRLEYDFVVAPGADPRRIRLAFEGQRALTVDDEGDLVIAAGTGDIRHQKPLVYQEIEGHRLRIPGRFVLDGTRVSFALGRYDHNRTLVIDPVLTSSTYLGGSGSDDPTGVAVDASGSAYVAGSTTSIDFPMPTDPSYDKTCGDDRNCNAAGSPPVAKPDVFVSKLSPGGSRLEYSTYLGGSRDDRGLGIALDSQANAYVTGRTDSANFPTSTNAFDRTCGSDGTCNERGGPSTKSDAFLAKLSPDGGRLEYSSYLGGSGEENGNVTARAIYTAYRPPDDPLAPGEPGPLKGAPGQLAGAVALDSGGRAYVTGVTYSPDFDPITRGPRPFVPYDSTCGTDGACNKSTTPDFSGKVGEISLSPDAFLAIVDTQKGEDQSVVYATYLGGSLGEAAFGVAVATDSSSTVPNAYITGLTYSPRSAQPGDPKQNPTADPNGFPTTENAFQKSKPAPVAATENGFNGVPFMTRVDPTVSPASALRYSTFIGGRTGASPDIGYGIAVDSSGNVFVTGETDSNDLPTKSATENKEAFQAIKNTRTYATVSTTDATFDGFLAKLDTTKAGTESWVYSTYLGGIDQDSARGVALDPSGLAYVTGYTGSTSPNPPDADEGRLGRFPLVDAIQGYLSPDTLEATCTGFSRGIQSSPGILSRQARCRDAFVTVVASDGSDVVYSTFLRGTRYHSEAGPEDKGTAIATWKDSGSSVPYAYVAGQTGNRNFPTVDAYQAGSGGYADAFLARVATVPPPTPFVAALDKAVGSSSGGTEVTIAGTGLGGATGARFNTTEVPIDSASPNGDWVKVTTPPGSGTVPVRIISPAGTSPVSSFAMFEYFDGRWQDENEQGTPTPRYGHAAILLTGSQCGVDCGKILMAGGNASGESIADLFDPELRSFTSICSTASPCPAVGTVATPLLDGSVLFVGSTSAQRYYPATRTWEAVSKPRSGPVYSATLIRGTPATCGENCGKVLLLGGGTADLYDPQLKVVTPTAPPVDPKGVGHTATLLSGPDCDTVSGPTWCGKILAVGGSLGGNSFDHESSGSAELYDPAAVRPVSPGAPAAPAGAWTGRTAVTARYGHTATALNTGKVLITGGILSAGGNDANTGRALGATEIYDPTKPFEQAFSLVNELLTPRSGHAAVALPDGRAIVVGGAGDRVGAPPIPNDPGGARAAKREPLANAEIYDPQLGGWRQAASMSTARGHGPQAGGHSATLLTGPRCGSRCGQVFVFGGTTTDSSEFPTSTGLPTPLLGSGELFTPGPYISALDPASGRAAGGDKITVRGSYFVPGSTAIAFAGRAAQRAPDDPADSSTAITVRSPVVGGVVDAPVTALVPGLGLALAPRPFSYTGLPGAVTDLTADAISGNEVSLSFSAPGKVEQAGDPATDYVIKQSRGALTAENFDSAPSLCETGVCKFTPTRRGLTLSLSVANLTPETSYYYALRARNDQGQLGPISNTAEATTATVPPGGVIGLAVAEVGEDSVKLTFPAAGSNGPDGPPATRYIVKQSPVPIGDAQGFEAGKSLCTGGVCTLVATNIGDPLTLTVAGLKRGTTYHFAVRALDDAGNLGPISNSVSAVPGCAAIGGAQAGQVAYTAGYHLVGVPGGTRLPSQSPLFGWFDLGAGGRYSSQDPAQAVQAGRGYWAWFSCPRLVSVGSGTEAIGAPLGAYRASMFGNPSGARAATVTGHDFAARWDSSLNGGAGGYRMSGYQQTETLAVGEGLWAFSYRDTTVTVRAQ